MDLSDEEVKEMVVEATGSADDEHIEYEDFLRIFGVKAKEAEKESPEAEAEASPRPGI